MTAKDLILSMRASWNKTAGWVKWILSFTRLGQFFNDVGHEGQFLETYLSSFFFTRWFFKIMFLEDSLLFDDLISACEILKDKKLLKPEIISEVLNHPELSYISSIIMSSTEWSLDSLQKCLQHPHLQSVIDTITFLKNEGMFRPFQLPTILNTHDLILHVIALKKLKDYHMFNLKNIDQVLINHGYADALVYFGETQNDDILEKKDSILKMLGLYQNIKLFRYLEKNHLLNKKIIHEILILNLLAAINPKVSEVIGYLSDANILNEDKFQQILQIYRNTKVYSASSSFKNIESLAYILSSLQSLEILNEANYHKVLESDSDALASVIKVLEKLKLLNQDNLLKLMHFKVNAFSAKYLNATILNQTYFDLMMLYPNPSNLFLMMDYLEKVDMLNHETLGAVLNCKQSSSLWAILKTLFHKKLLNQENFSRLLPRWKNLDPIKDALEKLSLHRLLSQEIFETILAHADTKYLSDLLLGLDSTQLLTPENLKTVREKFKDVFHFICIDALIEDNILDQIYFDATFNSVNTEFFIEALDYLKENDLRVTTGILYHLSRHQSPDDLAKAIHILSYHALLDDDYIKAVASVKFSDDFAKVLVHLDMNNILNPWNIQQLQQHPSCKMLTRIIPKLSSSTLLNQQNLVGIMNPQYAVLLTEEIYNNLFRRLTDEQLFENWAEIVRISRQAGAEDALIVFAREILLQEQFQVVQAGHIDFNHSQSTHTASIHETVSRSAINLMQRYGHRLPDEQQQILTTLVQMIQKLSDHFINLRVKTCIVRLVHDAEPHLDPVSNVNLHQMIALIYMAIHDDHLRIGSLDDALKELYEGLFEIERGKNINDDNVFNPDILDAPICPGGTFNKIVNRLQGRHPDVELVFMTPETASLKFIALVEQEAVHYLMSLPIPQNIQEFIQLTDLMKEIEEDGLEIIWDKIENKVAELLFDEFQSLFTKGIESHQFRGLISQGIYLKLKDSHCLQERLQTSPGYQAFCKQHLSQESKIVENSLWSMRHCSAKHQHEFDKKMGLMIYPR